MSAPSLPAMTKAGFEADPWSDRNPKRRDKRAGCKDTWFDPE